MPICFHRTFFVQELKQWYDTKTKIEEIDNRVKFNYVSVIWGYVWCKSAKTNSLYGSSDRRILYFWIFPILWSISASEQWTGFSVTRFDALEPRQRPHMINHNHNHNPHNYFAKDCEKKDKRICSKYICERFLWKLVGDNKMSVKNYAKNTS